MKPIYIVGFSGFAREVYALCKELEYNKEICVKGFVNKPNNPSDTSKIFGTYHSIPVYNETFFDYKDKNIVIGVGDSKLRYNIYYSIEEKAKGFVTYPTLISTKAVLMNKDSMYIGKGVIICAGTILTCDITIRDFVQLNLNTTVGHDCTLGVFSTTAPGVNISGNVTIDPFCYLGTNSCVLEKIHITSNTIIGAGAVVTKTINEKGTYVGIPCRKIK